MPLIAPRFAVGKPSSRPRASPCTTVPRTRCARPRMRAASRTSPAASSARTPVEDHRTCESPGGGSSVTGTPWGWPTSSIATTAQPVGPPAAARGLAPVARREQRAPARGGPPHLRVTGSRLVGDGHPLVLADVVDRHDVEAVARAELDHRRHGARVVAPEPDVVPDDDGPGVQPVDEVGAHELLGGLAREVERVLDEQDGV